jgi:alkaline phosphatase
MIWRTPVVAVMPAKTVGWEMYATGPRKARNVVLFIGDAMAGAHRTAARILTAGC